MVQGTVTSADGTTIAYTAWGDGDPIVLIDGATAYRATTPENAQTAELLAGEFQVINYDRRGRGESGDTAPYAVEREFEDLAAIIEQAGGGRPATVFGWSSGGLLALNAVRRRPGRAPGAVRAAGHRRRQRPAAARRLRRAARRGRGRGPSGDAVALFMTAAAGMPEDAVAGMRGSEFWPGLEAIAPTIAYDGRNVGDTMSGKPLRADLWSGVRVPVLVLYGRDTWPHLAAGAKAVAAHLPTATLTAVPGENHGTTAGVLAPALREFIQGA